MAPANPPPLMSSDEVNFIVYAYLAESSLDHSAFTLYNESRLADFTNSDTGGHPAMPPTGHLIRILQKGLLYLQAEARHRGDNITLNPPRLVGYAIAGQLPPPSLPKTLPPPSPTASSDHAHSDTAREAYSGASSRAGTAPTTVAGNGLPSAPRTGSKRKTMDGDAAPSVNVDSEVNGVPDSTQQKSNKLRGKDDQRRVSDRDTASPGVADMQLPAGQPVNTKKQKIAAEKRKSSPRIVDENMDDNMQADGMEGPAGMRMSVEDAASTKEGKVKFKHKAGNLHDVEMENTAGIATAKGAASDNEKQRKKEKTDSTDRPSTATRPSSSGSSRPAGPLANIDASKSNKFKRDSAAGPRRSVSPTISRTPAAIAADKARPRSTSPATMRHTLGLSTSRGSTTLNVPTLPTPTLDATSPKSAAKHPTSKQSGAATTKALPNFTRVSPTKDAEKQIPQEIIPREKCLVLKGHTAHTQPCHWNPKVPSFLATGASDATARIWELPDGGSSDDVEATVCKHSSGSRKADVTAVEWNSEGTLLATGSEDGVARIWTPSGDLHLVLSMHQRTIFCLKWNNTGTMLLTGSLDHSVCLWDSSYGKVKQQWTSHSDSVLDLAWMTDDVFATCSMDKNINVHQIGRASPAYRFKGHTDEVNGISFDTEKSMLASCSDDKTVRVWSVQPVRSILNITASQINGMRDSGYVKKESDTDDPEWLERGYLVLKGHKLEVHAVAWCPVQAIPGEPKLLASASFDHTARIWDVVSGDCVHVITRHTDMVYSLAWQPSSGKYLATGSNDAKVCIHRISDRTVTHEYVHTGAVYEIAWHPTRNQIAACGKNEAVSIMQNFTLM